jgi:hypothetical protein
MDFAHERVVRIFKTLEVSLQEFGDFDEELYSLAAFHMPKVLIRDGDRYILRHGLELEGAIPAVSPDAFFFDEFFIDGLSLKDVRVPRGGELFPVKVSAQLSKVLKK